MAIHEFSVTWKQFDNKPEQVWFMTCSEPADRQASHQEAYTCVSSDTINSMDNV